MPTYNLRCKECGKVFEHFMSLDKLEKFKNDDVKIKCEECESMNTAIKITATKTRHKSWFTWTL